MLKLFMRDLLLAHQSQHLALVVVTKKDSRLVAQKMQKLDFMTQSKSSRKLKLKKIIEKR